MAKPITLYFLQASRSIRTAWLLEKLNVPYTLEFSDRVSQKAPADFKEKSGNPLGKFPSIDDNGLIIAESGAISEYLLDKYDTDHALLPIDQPRRVQAQQWLHAAEATFALHGLAILYARWQFPEDAKKATPGAVEEMEKKLSVNIVNDFNWLERELAKSSGPFLLGAYPTIADIMMEFSVEFVQERELGIKKGAGYPKIQEWLKACHEDAAYKKAIEKTGHTLYPAST